MFSLRQLFSPKYLPTICLFLILLLGLFLRFRQLDYPAQYYFDEVYHLPTATMIARGDPRAFEWWHPELSSEFGPSTYIDWLHPPLAKLFQAASINLLGNNPWGWRLPSAIASSLLIIVVYWGARAIWPARPFAALIAALLIAIDGFVIAQSRLAMNDIFLTLFMTLSVIFYYFYLHSPQTKKWLLLLSLTTGCAIASKWSGVFLFLFFGLWEFARVFLCKKTKFLSSFCLFIFLGSTSLLIYLLSYLPLFLQHDFSHFLELHRQIILYQTGLDATHPYSSQAWEWPLGLKPVYFHLDPVTHQEIWNRPFYPSWYFTLICLFIALGLVIYHLFRRPKRSANTEKLTFLLLAYFCFWVPWLFSPRIMFFYHYLPAVPILCLLAGYVSGRLTKIHSY